MEEKIAVSKEEGTKFNAYFDMIEYFCNSHDDTAVDVIVYDCNGKKIKSETFSWAEGCGEVTSEGIWQKADEFAHHLMQNGKKLRHRRPLFKPRKPL